MQNDFIAENINEKEFIDYIVEKVIGKLISGQKKALLLFTGATLGFNQSIMALNMLKADGWQFKSVMSLSAESVLNKQLIQDLSPQDEIITEGSGIDLKSLIKNYNFIIVPALSINTAAKISGLISDNLITNIVSGSLKAGKNVIVCINACCPDNEERNKMGFYVTEAYKEKLRFNMKTMSDFGIKLTIAENLEKKIKSLAAKNMVFLKNDAEMKIDSISQGNSIALKDKVINKGLILNNSNFSAIKIEKDSVITKLAQDEANKLNIKIIKE